MKTNHTGKLNSYLFKKTEVYAFPLSTACTGHAWGFFRQPSYPVQPWPKDQLV